MALKKSSVVKRIATERIAILHKLALEAQDSDPELAKKYVKIMQGISSHYRIKLDKGTRNSICKKCGVLLLPGKTLSVRLASSKRQILYKCMRCGFERRIPY